MKHTKLAGGQYASAAHEFCADLQSYFGIDEARSVEIAFRWKSEYGRVMSRGQVTPKYGAKLSKGGEITLGGAMSKLKTYETVVLQLGAFCARMRDISARFNSCKVDTCSMLGHVREYVDALALTELPEAETVEKE